MFHVRACVPPAPPNPHPPPPRVHPNPCLRPFAGLGGDWVATGWPSLSHLPLAFLPQTRKMNFTTVNHTCISTRISTLNLVNAHGIHMNPHGIPPLPAAGVALRAGWPLRRGRCWRWSWTATCNDCEPHMNTPPTSYKLTQHPHEL